jgi:hypothetical protein
LDHPVCVEQDPETNECKETRQSDEAIANLVAHENRLTAYASQHNWRRNARLRQS